MMVKVSLPEDHMPVISSTSMVLLMGVVSVVSLTIAGVRLSGFLSLLPEEKIRKIIKRKTTAATAMPNPNRVELIFLPAGFMFLLLGKGLLALDVLMGALATGGAGCSGVCIAGLGSGGVAGKISACGSGRATEKISGLDSGSEIENVFGSG